MLNPDPGFPSLPVGGTNRYFADIYDWTGEFIDQFSINYNPGLDEFGTIKRSSGACR